MGLTYCKAPSARHTAIVWALAAAVLCRPVVAAAGQAGSEDQFRSGGIGLDERLELQAARDDYNLRLAFVTTSGEYLANVQVTLYQDRGGRYREIHTGNSEGPWFFARVAPGRYRIEATYRGETRKRDLSVGTQQKAPQIVMQWPGGAERR